MIEEVIKEKCDCCNGKGLLPSFFIDDLSPCMNCNGSGTLKYTKKIFTPKKCPQCSTELTHKNIALLEGTNKPRLDCHGKSWCKTCTDEYDKID